MRALLIILLLTCSYAGEWFNIGLYEDFSTPYFKDLKNRIKTLESSGTDIVNLLKVVRVEIFRNTPFFSWPNTMNHNGWVKKSIQRAIKKACDEIYLHDCVFFICPHDQYDFKEHRELFKIPVLVSSKHKGSLDEIAMPDWEALRGYKDIAEGENPDKFISKIAKEFKYNLRKPQLIWRGICSGKEAPTPQWPQSNRGYFVFWANNPSPHPVINAKFSPFLSTDPDLDASMQTPLYTASKLSIRTQCLYKFLLDIDGWGCTYSRLYWILGSGSTCLKLNSPLEQWYYRGLIPGKHYVPIEKDFAKLEQTVQYLIDHEDEASTIAKNARAFWKKYLCQDFQYYYLAQLLHIYSCLYNGKREILLGLKD